MTGRYVDLHIHSCYSDGSMTPDEIVNAALKKEIGVLAVADHDATEGSARIKSLCKQHDIVYIPAVEVDALEKKTNFHILAYNFDINDQEFSQFLEHVRFLLDEFSVKLIETMQKDNSGITLSEYMKFDYDRNLGGWKALHYLKYKGLTSTLKEGIRFYPRYDITYDKSGFPSISSVCYRIKKAGGYAVLAHPGELLDSSDMAAFSKELRRIISLGLDGIECYYPTHSESVTQACLDICAEKDLLITAGSDCHGVFGKTEVGEIKIPMEKVSLKGLTREAIKHKA